ncbi:MAG TPA: LysE family transporter [Candidatus Limnocylindria bacterium]
MLDAVWAGLLAGYAIAIPMGPITILIVDIGLTRGFRPAAAAAAGAASADGIYATVAGLFGAALAAALGPVILPARLLGAGVLGVLGLRGLLLAMRRVGRSGIGRHLGQSGARRTYVLLLALTIANPMTFVYFSALTLGLPATATAGAMERLAFAAAAFTASLSWQLLLAAVGSLLHGRLPPTAVAVTRAVGALIVLAFAARIALDAVNR